MVWTPPFGGKGRFDNCLCPGVFRTLLESDRRSSIHLLSVLKGTSVYPAIRKLALISMVVAGISSALFTFLPANKYFIRDTRYLWLRDQIFGEPAKNPIDIAFFGSSHTWVAVDTPFINRVIPGIRTLNFGVNWHGNDIQLALIRDLLGNRSVKKLVLEITLYGDESRHDYFPFLAELSDVVREAVDLRPASRPDFPGWAAYPRKQLARVASLSLPFFVKGIYGIVRRVRSGPPLEETESGFLGRDAKYRFKEPTVRLPAADGFYYGSKFSIYFQEIAKLCRQHGVGLYLLYVPDRNGGIPTPGFLKELSSFGTPILLSFTEIYQPENWYNGSHLNRRGARAFTRQLLRSPLF